MIGELIAGKYRVEGELGTGGMGAVYRARVIKNARPVAIKVLRADVVDQEQYEERFASEVLVTSKVDHENIVHVEEHGYLPDGRMFLVLELLTGRSLGEIMYASGTIEWRRALRIMREVARALAEVHRHEVVHRDIKPENIFLLPHEGGESVKLMDFGLAKPMHASAEAADLTQPGFAIGTPTYMAPERVTGEYDGRADLYGLAVVTYEMLTGSPPFVGDPQEILREHMLSTPKPLHEANPALDLPSTVQSLMTKAMAKRVQERFQSAEELIEQLDLALVGDSDRTIAVTSAPEWTWRERLAHQLEVVAGLPKRVKALVVVNLLVVVVALVMVVVVRSHPASSAPVEAQSGVAAADDTALAADSPEEAAQPPKAPKSAAEERASSGLQSLEAAIAELGFVAEPDSKSEPVMQGALACRNGVADGLVVSLCAFDQEVTARRAQSTLLAQDSASTMLALAEGPYALVVSDPRGVDPEGRKIQQFVERFRGSVHEER